MIKITKQKWWIIILCLIIVVVSIYLIVNGAHFISRSGVRNIRVILNSFGIFSPLAVVFLISISTVIPPLPLPIPLVEIASGIAFGLAKGFLVVWISQIISSLLAFYLARHFGNKYLKNFLEYKFFKRYREYLTLRGGWAVFYIRAVMAAPLNIISFMAGLSEIDPFKFALSTALGTIPESLLFTFLGSRIRIIRPNFWYLSAALIVLGAFGLITMLTMNRGLRKGKLTQS